MVCLQIMFLLNFYTWNVPESQNIPIHKLQEGMLFLLEEFYLNLSLVHGPSEFCYCSARNRPQHARLKQKQSKKCREKNKVDWKTKA